MSDDEGYAPAAQMLICFIFSACVQKNTDSDDRCQFVFPLPSFGDILRLWTQIGAQLMRRSMLPSLMSWPSYWPARSMHLPKTLESTRLPYRVLLFTA